MFNQGSLTHVGSPDTAPNAANSYAEYAYLDVNGADATVYGTPVMTSAGPPAVYTYGATFVNDWYVVDSSGGWSGTNTIVADGTTVVVGPHTYYGGLVKGERFLRAYGPHAKRRCGPSWRLPGCGPSCFFRVRPRQCVELPLRNR